MSINRYVLVGCSRKDFSRKLGLSVPPKDSISLANAIKNGLVLPDEDLRRINAEAKIFIKNYDWKYVVKKIISLYEDTIKTSNFLT